MKYVAMVFAASVALISPTQTTAKERVVTTFDGSDSLRWIVVNDNVMGGISEGNYVNKKDGTLTFSGNISLENNGGFSSIRTQSKDLKLGEADGLKIRVRGDGRPYKLSLRTRNTPRWIAYWADFKTKKGEWTTVTIPFAKWVPTALGRKLGGPDLKPAMINSVGFMLYDKKAGPFKLEVDSIMAFHDDKKQPEQKVAEAKDPNDPVALIELAIKTGVPLYNGGNEEGCAAVYQLAATALLGLEGKQFSDDVRKRLSQAIASAETSDKRAWALRKALDAAYAEVKK